MELWTKNGRPLSVSDANVYTKSGAHVGRISGDKVYDPSGSYVGTIVGDRLVDRHSARTGSASVRRRDVAAGKSATRDGSTIWGDEPDIPA